MNKILVLFFVLTPIVLQAQNQQDSIWMPFRKFIGKWEGTSVGFEAEGKYARTYQFILGNQYIEIRNRFVYPPTKDNPKEQIHEDVAYISHDRLKKVFILRQFTSEGFVNQFKSESISPDGQTIVFVTEYIENVPPNFRARETYRFSGNTEFTESFDFAESGKSFEPYSRGILKKVK